MRVVGITGGIGSGKSTVSSLFSILGVPTYVADDRSKYLLANDMGLKYRLKKAFGDGIFCKGDEVDKKKFASIIFSDDNKLALANSIIHPCVEADFSKWIEEKSNMGYRVVAIETAILFEAGFNKFTTDTVLVYASPDIRLKRVVVRDKIADKQVLERMRAQAPDEQKAQRVDELIFNDGSCSLIAQVDEFVGRIFAKVQ